MVTDISFSIFLPFQISHPPQIKAFFGLLFLYLFTKSERMMLLKILKGYKYYNKNILEPIKFKSILRETSPIRAGVAEPRLKIWDKNLGQKFGTDRQTDKQTDRAVCRVALQLTMKS